MKKQKTWVNKFEQKYIKYIFCTLNVLKDVWAANQGWQARLSD